MKLNDLPNKINYYYQCQCKVNEQLWLFMHQLVLSSPRTTMIVTAEKSSMLFILNHWSAAGKQRDKIWGKAEPLSQIFATLGWKQIFCWPSFWPFSYSSIIFGDGIILMHIPYFVGRNSTKHTGSARNFRNSALA